MVLSQFLNEYADVERTIRIAGEQKKALEQIAADICPIKVGDNVTISGQRVIHVIRVWVHKVGDDWVKFRCSGYILDGAGKKTNWLASHFEVVRL